MTKTYEVTVEIRMLATVTMPVEEDEVESGQTMADEAVAKVETLIGNGEFKSVFEEDLADALWYMDIDKDNAQIIAATEWEV